MTRHDEMFDEISEDHMAELLERTVRRGTRLRRRTMAVRVSLAALVICAVAVPLGLSLSHQQGPPSSAAIAVTSGTPFQDVVWEHVDYRDSTSRRSPSRGTSGATRDLRTASLSTSNRSPISRRRRALK